MRVRLLAVELMIEHFVESPFEIESRISPNHFGDVIGIEPRVLHAGNVVGEATLHQATGVAPELVHVPSV
jgi:hypothetical protein